MVMVVMIMVVMIMGIRTMPGRRRCVRSLAGCKGHQDFLDQRAGGLG